MAESAPKATYWDDPHLYLYTSLTSGSSHIVTATSRMETILKANRIPFLAIDTATDEKARMLWGLRAKKDESGRQRKLPGLVQMGLVIGDLVEVEDWNEYGELKQHVTIVGTPNYKTAPPKTSTAPRPVLKENVKPTATAGPSKAAEPVKLAAESGPSSIALTLRQAGQEAALKAKDTKKKAVTEVLSDVGKAEPVEKAEPPKETPAGKEAEVTKEAGTVKGATAKSAVIPPPIAILDPKTAEKHATKGPTMLQSPNSTTWKTAPFSKLPTPRTPRHSFDKINSVQSPTSTAWRPTDTDGPILTHRGSSISLASTEEIKQVEEEEAIQEEDENEDDNEEEEDEDEDEDEDGGEDAKKN